MLLNTSYWQEAGNHFKKYKRYDDGVRGSLEWNKYWDREEKRCLDGYSVGGEWISGFYYHYLNYCPIQITDKTFGQVHKEKVKHSGQRKEQFPAIWDVDYAYYRSLDIAQNGITLQAYKKLPIDLGLIEDDYNLSGGHHLIWTKPRGVGASFKGAALLSRNYHLIRKSRGYIFASDKTFLEDDGIFSKFIDMRSFINSNASGFRRRHDVKNDIGGMHVQASFYDDAGNPSGYLSDVFGLSLKNDIQKGKGKRGQLIEWEELGKFPGADRAWEIARESVEELDVVYGTMVGFGTGAVEGADYKALEAMSYDPESYNVLCFENKWDENSTGTKFAMFTPAYYTVQKKDKDGNSDIESGKKIRDKEREIGKKSSDPTLYTRKCAENPYCPSEAFDAININIFPKAGIKAWRTKLLQHGRLANLGVCGKLEASEFGVKFSPSDNYIPVYDFPIKKQKDGTKLNLTGCVVIYQAPYRIAGKVPKNLYIVCVDPYAQDETTGDSVGAAYVIKNVNRQSKPDDFIVASYVGRPALQDDFADNVIALAEYYGCKIGFENDRGEAFLGRIKIRKKTHLLQEEFELQYNSNVSKTGVRRTWGMHMSSGKDDKRKQDGNKYIQEWLNRERGIDAETGEIIYNYHLIYDPGLLEELIRYGKGNFDRVSALRIGMYHLKEIEYVESNFRQEQSPHSAFFGTVLFQN